MLINSFEHIKFPVTEKKLLARIISLIENKVDGSDEFLMQLPLSEQTKIIGITGPPGAGKSTLTNAMIAYLVDENKQIGVLCIDPSSPFNMGALLGDRIRMNQWHNHPNVFIRSLATRGSLGGLTANIIEITDIMKAALFDYIIIETVGVGQSEIEIAGLADTTILVLVPEAGDEVQIMKAGIMEIADVFVVNKADKSGAEQLVKELTIMLSSKHNKENFIVPVIQTIATQKQGISELMNIIIKHSMNVPSEKKMWLLAEKLYQLIQKKRMKNIDKEMLIEIITKNYKKENFNLYKIANDF